MRLSHILVFVIVLIVIFGASKLPDIARNLGKSAKILKEEMRDLQNEPTSAAASVAYATESAKSGVGPDQVTPLPTANYSSHEPQ